MAKTLYIIDGHAHIYAAYYAPMSQRLTSPAGEPTKATYIFTTTLAGLIQSQKPDMLAVAMDSKTPVFRTKIYPEYKAHRPPMPDDMPVQINRIEQILDAMNVPVLRLDGYEADDIIGTLAQKAAKEGTDVFVCSKDKDMYQLVDEHIYLFDVKKGEVIKSDTLFEKYKIRPENFIDVLALQGDISDNVPGVPLIGEMNAIKLIQQYGSLDNLYEHADSIEGKRGENLRMYKKQAYISRKLVTIDTDSPLKIGLGELKLKQPNRDKLTHIFTELGFSRLLSQMGLSESKAAEPAKEKTQHAFLLDIGRPASAKTVDHDYQLIDTPDKFNRFAAELKKQKLFAIDTETTSINAMMAELVGISFSWQQRKAFYLPVKGPLGAKCLDLEAVRQAVAPILSDESIKKIGQNIKYDMLVLRNAGLDLNGIYFDTMVASYCLDPLHPAIPSTIWRWIFYTMSRFRYLPLSAGVKTR